MDLEEKNLTIVEIRIKFLRDLKGLLQKDLAKDLNVSRSLVNSWENGYSNITLKQLTKLAHYYKVPVDYILGLTTKFDASLYDFKEDLDLEYLGKRIRLIRKMENLNQTDFSSKIHIDRSSLSLYENGKSAMANANLKEICDTFGYSADWCLGNTLECIRRDNKVKIKPEEIREFIAI